MHRRATHSRLAALAALTAVIWLTMSIGAVIVLILGVGWAASTIITEAVFA